MGWTHIEDNNYRARKRHVCELCGQFIEPGWKYVSRFGCRDGKAIRSAMHVECEDISSHWDDIDWETHHAGDGDDWPEYDIDGKAKK